MIRAGASTQTLGISIKEVLMTELTETFSQKVVLLLIDKIAIGALIGLGAFCASVLLERLKATISFRSEVDKVRVQKMGDLWNIFAQAHTKLEQAIVGKARIVREEVDILDNDTKARIMAAGVTPDNAKHRIVSEIKPIVEQGLQELTQAWPILEGSRFWLGERLYNMHVEHLNVLTQLSNQFTNSLLSNELGTVMEQIPTRLKASWTRLDIKKVEKAL